VNRILPVVAISFLCVFLYEKFFKARYVVAPTGPSTAPEEFWTPSWLWQWTDGEWPAEIRDAWQRSLDRQAEQMESIDWENETF